MPPLITTHALIWELRKLVKLQICQYKWTKNLVMLGSTTYWHIPGFTLQDGRKGRGWLSLTFWLAHWYKVFSTVPNFLLFDYKKQQHATFGNCLYCTPVTAAFYSLIFIGRLYAKCNSNLLPCHVIPHWLRSLGEEHQTRLNKQLGHKTEIHCLCIGSKACCKDFSCLPISQTLIALVSHSREQ